MPQIFGCPYCQNPFGVPDNAAGQTFTCPSCDQPVEVPDLSEPEPQVQQSDQQPEVYSCPHCEGKFGIDSSMYGQQLACPHCAKHVAIGEQPVPAPPRVEEDVFDVVIVDEPVIPPLVTSKTPKKKSKTPKKKSPSEKAAPAITSRQKGASRKPGKIRQKPKTKAPQVEKVEGSTPPPGSSSSPIASSSAPETLEPPSVAHLLPPPFDVPDPVRFPNKIGANEVLLPDGQGGYQTAEANVVTITYQGKVYHLQRLTPEERRKRQLIHNAIAIMIAVLLLFLTLQAIGLFS